MATIIIKQPSRIHTAFNPVILQVRATTEIEKNSAALYTLTSGANTSSVSREFFNDLAKFDVSEILKHWFSDEKTVLPQTDSCYLDKRLAFEYGIDLKIYNVVFSQSPLIAVNAVVQLQRNPDMTTWGNRFLTDMPAIKKYKGYPLDISYLNNAQNAFVSFNGATLNRDTPITNLHFSITIPDDTTSVMITDVPLTVNLLTNQGIEILSNNLKNIVIKNPLQAALQIEKGIIPACNPDSPFYVRWINRLGGFDYRMFYLNQTFEQSVKTKTVVTPVIDDILNSSYLEKEIDKEAGRVVSVGAGQLTNEEYNEIVKISTSPLVEVWDTDVQKWYRAYVASGKYETDTKDQRKEIEIELTLPTIQTQF
jgi:hypothetical protein